MEVKMIKLPPMPIIVGSSQKFRGIPEPGDHNKRPLMVNAWSQTTGDDFSYLNEIENREKQSQREIELEEKIRILEENLKAHTELLSQIHATSARTTALLSQQPTTTTTQQYNSTTIQVTNSNSNNINSPNANRPPPHLSPKIVNAINPLQQVSGSPAESVKYTIIAEGNGNENGEPIEIQLAEDDGALNLNCSADSGRLEICLAPEENIEIKTEYNNGNNAATTMQQQMPATISSDEHHHFIKRRKMAAEQLEALSTSTQYINNDYQTVTSYNNVPAKLPLQTKRRSSGNSLLKSPKVQITNIQTTPIQDIIPSPTNNNSNSSFNSANGDTSIQGIDTDNVMVSIGPNNTRIPAKLYENMNWSSASIATRKLLMAIFDRNVLATHSMTGRPSPAFKDHGKPLKQQLDPLIIADIIFAVTRKCKASDKEVRNAITTKCADENKMMKLQMNKRTPMREMNKENMMV